MRHLWKKRMSAVVALVLMLSGIPEVAGSQVNAQEGNLVTNGDFENGLTGWDNWSESDKFKATAESVHDGNGALLVESTSQDWVGLTQNIAVEKNTTYELSFWGKNASMFCYKIMDSSWSSNLIEQYPTGNGEYQQYTATFDSGDNETVILYISDAATNGYYDNFSIVKKGGNPVAVEFDGGFESGNLDGWQNSDAPDKFMVSSEDVYEGNFALKISSVSQEWKCIKYNLPIATNYMYRISFYAKGEATTYFKVINKDMTAELAGGVPNSSSGEWTLNSYEFNSKSNNEIVLYFADTAGTVYIDNIVIERLSEVPVNVTEVINGDFSDGLNGWDISASGEKFTVSGGDLYITSDAANGNYIEQKIYTEKGTYYTVSMNATGADTGYKILDLEKKTILADEKDNYFCSGNNSAINLRILDTEGNAVVNSIKIEEALIQPNNNRPVVNASGEITEVKLTDSDATAAVRSLYVYLQEVGKNNLLFGHQTDNSESIVKKDNIVSDTYHTVGAYPAITGFEMGNIVMDMDYYVRLVQQAYKNNSVATVCDHMPNFSSEATGSTWSDMTPTYAHIMPGGKDHEKFLQRLDQMAEFALSCVDENGELIPIIYRPFHENSGMWFWWGVSNTSKDEFVNLWRYTVEYLRDEKGVHNLLFAYSPNGHFSSEDNYLSRYPGDDYVDIIGFDIYHDNPSYESKWMQQTLKDAQITSGIASKKGKVAAITEVGIRYNGSDGLAVEDNAMKDWYSQLYNALTNDESAKQIAYMMTWRNQDKTHFWVPYDDGEGDRHEMANDFTVFYNHDNVIFADRMGNYADLQGIRTVKHENSVYFVAPTTGEKIKGTADVILKVNADESENVKNVKLYVGENAYNAEYSAPYYIASFDTTTYDDGNYQLKAIVTLDNGVSFEADKNIKIWNDESTSDVNTRVFDNFDGYFGETEQLNQAYNRNTNGDVNEVSLIDSPFGTEYGKALKFEYSVSTGGPGYSGTAKTLNYDITSLNSKGISFWFQGDGRGADILLQVNMPNCFEVHLNDLSTFDKDSTQPQYIEIMWDEFKTKGHVQQKDLSDIQTYAIYVNGTGIESSTLIFDEICVIAETPVAGQVSVEDKSGYLKDADSVKNAVLTESDKKLIESGKNIQIIMEIEKLSNLPADSGLIDAALGGKKVVYYLNIDLLKKIEGESATLVHEIGGKIELVLPVPAELIKSGRTFSVIYVHDGVVKMLSDQDSIPETVTIAANEFSTYALVYAESGGNNGGNAGGNNSGNADGNNSGNAGGNNSGNAGGNNSGNNSGNAGVGNSGNVDGNNSGSIGDKTDRTFKGTIGRNAGGSTNRDGRKNISKSTADTTEESASEYVEEPAKESQIPETDKSIDSTTADNSEDSKVDISDDVAVEKQEGSSNMLGSILLWVALALVIVAVIIYVVRKYCESKED